MYIGQETTANLLSFCLVELGNHPEIMHRYATVYAKASSQNFPLKNVFV